MPRTVSLTDHEQQCLSHLNRADHSRPIVEALKSQLEALAPEVVPKSLLGKAVHYALGQWPKLVRFPDQAVIPLDNNRAENAIRTFVMGRKAWLFAATPNGAVASARLYSLVETAKAKGVEPHAYLTHSSGTSRNDASLPSSSFVCRLVIWFSSDAL